VDSEVRSVIPETRQLTPETSNRPMTRCRYIGKLGIVGANQSVHGVRDRRREDDISRVGRDRSLGMSYACM
jgi:hypothetical protein